MAHRARLVSSALLAPGILLVFLGLSAALGFTPIGTLASAAAIAALLYAGARWQQQPLSRTPDHAQVPLIVFDRDCRIVTGSGAGEPVTAQFPEFLRPEIERRCAEALAGTTANFVCLHNGCPTRYEAVPVRRADGTIVFGILLTTESSPSIIVKA